MKKVLRLFTCLCLSLSVLCNVSVFADETSEITHNSWGADVLMVDDYIEYANEHSNGNSAIVAVLDSGVDYTHDFLKDRITYNDDGTVLGYDFVDRDSDPMDEGHNYHGTHVAGIVADLTQTTDVKIMPVRVSNIDGYLDSQDVADGIYFAVDHGADVINCSFYVDYGDFSLVDEAVAYATEHNVTVVAAAGNDGASLDTTLSNQCPQHIDEVIVVGSLKPADELNDYYPADSSNYGSKVDVAAPGVGILSCLGGETNDYQYMSGTSMATPHISACCALLYLTNPDITPGEVDAKIKDCCLDLVECGLDERTGYGLPQMKYIAYPDTHHEIGNCTWEAFEGTCVQTGNIKFHNCKNCNKLLDDDGNVIPIEEIVTPVNMSIHPFDEVVMDQKDATCTTEGYTGDTYCSGCWTLLSKGTVIPVNSNNHVWDQGVVTKAASKTSEGLMTYTCQNCKQVKTEVIAKLGDTTNTQTTTKVPNTGIYTDTSVLILAACAGVLALDIKRRRK